MDILGGERWARTVAALGLQCWHDGEQGTQVHLKGAEGNSMLLYVWDAVLPEVRPRLRDARWNPLLQAGEALVKLLKVLRENEGAIPPRLHQDSHHTYCLRVS